IDTASISSVRSSSASCRRSSSGSWRRSAGYSIRSSSGVRLEMGRIDFGSNVRSSGAARDYESRRLTQKFRPLLEQIKVRHRLLGEKLGLRSGARRAEDRHKGGFSGGNVSADRLSGLFRRALDVEQIVGDLKGQSQIVGVAAQRGAQLVRRFSENRPGLTGKRNQ